MAKEPTKTTRSMNAFFKENVEEVKNVFYPASKRIKDENGNPVEWEIRVIPNSIMDAIKKKMHSGVVTGFEAAMEIAIAAIVYPNLNDSALQDSYGVKKKDELLKQMLTSAEIDALENFVMDANGYSDDFEAKVETAKNL